MNYFFFDGSVDYCTYGTIQESKKISEIRIKLIQDPVALFNKIQQYFLSEILIKFLETENRIIPDYIAADILKHFCLAE